MVDRATAATRNGTTESEMNQQKCLQSITRIEKTNWIIDKGGPCRAWEAWEEGMLADTVLRGHARWNEIPIMSICRVYTECRQTAFLMGPLGDGQQYQNFKSRTFASL